LIDESASDGSASNVSAAGYSPLSAGGTDCLTQAFTQVRADIQTFANRHARNPDDITLLAVSKTRPGEAVQAAAALGQRAFGENYVDEALEKIAACDAAQTAAQTAVQAAAKTAALEWHFIGTIQSRRCAAIATAFDWVHSVDRIKVARRLAERRPVGLSPLNICLQVNVDNEVGKGGVTLEELPELAAACAEWPTLCLRGLMAIPAPRDDMAGQRQAFRTVHDAFTALRSAGHDSLDTLSMGMSGDLEAAIAEGATIVRIGTALFGPRPRK